MADRINVAEKGGGAPGRGARTSLLPSWFKEEAGALRKAFFTLPKHMAELSGIRRSLPELIAASLVLNLLGLALPFTLLQVYDRIIPNTALDTMTALAVGIVIAVSLESALRVTRSAVTGWVSGRFEHLASKAAFAALLTQPLTEFERKGTGAHIEALNAIHALKEFYAGQGFLVLFDLPFAMVFLVMMALFGGQLVWVPLFLIAVFSVAALKIGHDMRKALSDRNRCDDSRINFIIETLIGIHTIKALGLEASMCRRHERLIEAGAQADFAVTDLASKSQSLSLLFSHLTTILVVAFGSVVVIDGRMTTGVLAACSLLAGRCIQPMQAALDRWTRFQTARLAEERLADVLKASGGEADAAALGRGAGDCAGREEPDGESYGAELVLEGVLSSPIEGGHILNGVDLRVAAGETIGVVGENGSGKSTFLAAIAGLEPISGGRVLIDGRDAAEMTEAEKSKLISLVPQKPEMFKGTVLENLTLFEPGRADAAKALAKEIGIDRFVSRLPLGYDTTIGDGSQDGMPMGVRQLISIVRALAKKPRLVLFDEANSSVDGAGDQAVRALFERIRGETTVILVTSRPSMLSLAGRRLELRGGKIGEPAAPSQPGAPSKDTFSPPAGEPLPAWKRSLLSGDARSALLGEVEAASSFGRCLSTLLTELKWTGDARHFAEALPHFQNKLDDAAFLNVMAHLGYSNATQEWRGRSVDPRVLPCLFIDADGRPSVLRSRAHPDLGIDAFNPEDGTTKVVDASDLFGTAHFFSTTTAAAGGWFRQTIARFHGLFWALLGQSLIINLLALGVPFFTMSVYDKVIGNGDVGMLFAFLAGVLIVVVGDEALRGLRSKAAAYVGARISCIAGTLVFERTLMLPLQLTERASVGSQLSRFKDLESFRDFFGGGIAMIIVDLPFILLYVVFLVAMGGYVALVPLASLLVFAVALMGLMPVVRRKVQAGGKAGTRRQEFIVESLLKMRPLRQVGLGPAWAARYRDLVAESAMAGYGSAGVSSAIAALSQALVVLSGMATMTVGVVLVVSGSMTAGALIASMMVVWKILGPIQTGFSLVQRFEQTRGSIRQLEALHGLKIETDGRPASNTGLMLTGAVVFDRVSLRYSNDAYPALLGLSFEVKPGQVMAILGPDGSGKSTVLKLVAGLYAPQAGSISIDDLDLRQIDPVELRKAIGYVPQTPQLFFGTIAQNLRLAQPTASDEELQEALALAGVWQEVDSLPAKMGTRVGDSRSNRVSSSLVQGISLARAYLRRSPVLLLDEPMTGMDVEGDRRFKEFIAAVKGRTTVLMVTHRPSHLGLADVVMVLDKGVVREIGTAEEVRAKLFKAPEPPKPAVDVKPAGVEAKPAAVETKPIGADAKPAVVEAKTTAIRIVSTAEAAPKGDKGAATEEPGGAK